ncbi:MAG: NADH-quinone oxidoreductase subunit L [Lachnospiraceae bacterium]|nr:NADH-quinone oxidoreductase subunit L [Lachnospiraceae bacterium]
MVPFLIIFPLVLAVLLYLIKAPKVLNILSLIGGVTVIAGVIYLTISWVMGGCKKTLLYGDAEIADHAILIGELVLMVFVTVVCIINKRAIISLLSIIPTLAIAAFELFGPKTEAVENINLDYLSILMCDIVGIIGSLIVIYAVGYMQGYHEHHKDVPDRRNYFFSMLFVFLGSMIGLVTSESLLWMVFFWEMTSVCSFMLIKYTNEEQAIINAFRALWMNLLGGTAMIAGIIYFGYTEGMVGLHQLVDSGSAGTIAIALLAFAALTKSAQLPFTPWLLGAMIAPTPSSALLHSATMVKAGVYLLLRLAPAMSGTTIGIMISLVGGFTFLATSFMAIAQSDGKSVLALSTVSNLGLMVACAGVGTKETVWAGVFLMIFHAISKSLLFQDVGSTENSLHSRDIEDMNGLLYKLPKHAAYMFIGIAGMFLAPFGMLISKWSALKASVDGGDILLVLFICFGSATTALYWTKWMGKLIAHPHGEVKEVKDVTKLSEMLSMTIHVVMMIAVCALFPMVSSTYVNPLVASMFGESGQVLSNAVLIILVSIILVVFAVPLLAYYNSKQQDITVKSSYMAGVNVGDNSAFTDSFGEDKEVVMSNYYFSDRLGLDKTMFPLQMCTTAAIVIMLIIIIGGALV